MKNIGVFYLKIFRFLEMKFSIYLNRRVFVMCISFLSRCNFDQNRLTNLAISRRQETFETHHRITFGTDKSANDLQNRHRTTFGIDQAY